MRGGLMVYSEDFITRYMGSISQVAGLKRYRFTDGKAADVEAVDFKLGSGLSFTVLPGRGMDIAWADYKGASLAYMSKTGIVSPAYYESEGMNWLRNFFAGLLTTCGLSNVGNPCLEKHEEIGDISHGLHGRICNMAAEQVSVFEDWVDGKYIMEVSGKMRGAQLHGENISLRRKISAVMGEKCFRLHDTIKNEGAYDHDLMLLYHINIGYPVLDRNSRFVCKTIKSTMMGEQDEQPSSEYSACHEPVKRCVQKCYSHDTAADEDGFVRAAVINDELGIGLGVCYKKDQLPQLTQWKTLSTGEYVIGIEPGTCSPVNRNWASENGQSCILASREIKEVEILFQVLDGKDEIKSFVER